MNYESLLIEDQHSIVSRSASRCSRRVLYIVLLCALLAIGLTLIVVLITLSNHRSSNDQTTYRADAAQYYPFLHVQNPNLTITKNLAQYELIIAEAARADVQITVFPEGSLGDISSSDRRSLVKYCEILHYPFDDASSDESSSRSNSTSINQAKLAPCQDPAFSFNYTSNLQVKTLSCLAQKYTQALTVNHCVREVCTPGAFNQSAYHFSSLPCPSDGQYLWSANIVYGPDGHIGAIYAKTHLFGSTWYDAASIDQPLDQSFYHSVFDVKFGTVICFDVEFRLPLSRILSSGVSHLLFSSWWATSQAPQLTSTMIQQSVAHKRSINLIAANSLSQRGQGGGIYHAGVDQTVRFEPFNAAPEGGEYALIIADLPKVPIVDANHFEANSNEKSRDKSAVLGDIPYVPASLSVPCTVTAIAEEGKCTFLQPINQSNQQTDNPSTDDTNMPLVSRQQSNVSHGGIQCIVDLQPSVDSSNRLSEYAIFASSSVYRTPTTPASLFMESCFVMRCVNQSLSQSISQSINTSEISFDADKPLQCVTSYNSSAMFDDIRLFAGLNCSRFDDPDISINQSINQSPPVNGTVLPMFATRAAVPESSSAFRYRFVGRSAGLCWWSMSTTRQMTEPLFSFGFYAIDGEEQD